MNVFENHLVISIYSYLSNKERGVLSKVSKFLYRIYWGFLSKSIYIDTNLNKTRIHFLEILLDIKLYPITITHLVIYGASMVSNYNSYACDYAYANKNNILDLLNNILNLKRLEILQISKTVIDFEKLPKSLEYLEIGNLVDFDYYYIKLPETINLKQLYNSNKNKAIELSIKQVLPNLSSLIIYGRIYDYINLIKLVL
jgi:hypothetical protein